VRGAAHCSGEQPQGGAQAAHRPIGRRTASRSCSAQDVQHQQMYRVLWTGGMCSVHKAPAVTELQAAAALTGARTEPAGKATEGSVLTMTVLMHSGATAAMRRVRLQSGHLLAHDLPGLLALQQNKCRGVNAAEVERDPMHTAHAAVTISHSAIGANL
jgi:hypothetical protein